MRRERDNINLRLFSVCAMSMMGRTTSSLVLMIVKVVVMKNAETFEC